MVRNLAPLSVDRVLGVLEHLAAQEGGQSLSGLSRALGVPKTSLFDLLNGLVRRGYVAYDTRHGYTLGPESFTLAATVLANREMHEIARPFIERLVEATGETVLLGCLANDGFTTVYLDKVESRNPIRYTVPLGARRELHCSAIGKVLLAFQPEAFIERYLRSGRVVAFTDATITDPSTLRAQLAEVRKTGIAWTEDERVLGASALAAPVFGSDGRIAAGLVVAGPTMRVKKARRRLSELVAEAAARISRAIGGRPPGGDPRSARGEPAGESLRKAGRPR